MNLYMNYEHGSIPFSSHLLPDAVPNLWLAGSPTSCEICPASDRGRWRLTIAGLRKSLLASSEVAIWHCL